MTKKKEEYYKISKSKFHEIRRLTMYANHSISSIGNEENLRYEILEKLAYGLGQLGDILGEMANIEYEGLKKWNKQHKKK